MMAQAKAAVAAVPGVQAAFRDYTVGYADERKKSWTAQQTVELRGADAAPFLDLVGTLQAAGLTVDDLDWRVSDEKADQAPAATPTTPRCGRCWAMQRRRRSGLRSTTWWT